MIKSLTSQKVYNEHCTCKQPCQHTKCLFVRGKNHVRRKLRGFHPAIIVAGWNCSREKSNQTEKEKTRRWVGEGY